MYLDYVVNMFIFNDMTPLYTTYDGVVRILNRFRIEDIEKVITDINKGHPFKNEFLQISWRNDLASDSAFYLKDFYDKMFKHIDISPDILNGKPVLSGTKFPVSTILSELVNEECLDKFAIHFGLETKQISSMFKDLALFFDRSFIDSDDINVDKIHKFCQDNNLKSLDVRLDKVTGMIISPTREQLLEYIYEVLVAAAKKT